MYEKVITNTKVIHDYNNLKKIATKYFKCGKYEKALRTIFVVCGFMYTYGQIFVDDELEEVVQEIGKELGIELVGDLKVKILINEEEDPWDEIVEDPERVEKEIDNEVNENFINEEVVRDNDEII